VVAQVPGDWNRQKTQHAAQDLITAHPDLKALYIENEDMAIGAILALKRAGKLSQVMVVSCNGAPYGLEAIGNGEIQASNTCSPALEAVMGLRVLTGVIGHTAEPGHLYYSLTVFVTRQNKSHRIVHGDTVRTNAYQHKSRAKPWKRYTAIGSGRDLAEREKRH
jgi:ribose transport system substrate-binding protein